MILCELLWLTYLLCLVFTPGQGERGRGSGLAEVQLLCNLVELSSLSSQYGLPPDVARRILQMAYSQADGVFVLRLGRPDSAELLQGLAPVPNAVDLVGDGFVARWRLGTLQVLRSRTFSRPPKAARETVPSAKSA